MNAHPPAKGAFTLTSLLMATCAFAAMPVEQDVERESAVRYTGSSARPIGSIEYSASGQERRRFGPWAYDAKAYDRSRNILIYDDGSVQDQTDGTDLRRQSEGGRHCTTSGNLTVCK